MKDHGHCVEGLGLFAEGRGYLSCGLPFESGLPFGSIAVEAAQNMVWEGVTLEARRPVVR